MPAATDDAVVALLEWEQRCELAPSVGCSGVLVSPRVVLTAAHCVDPLMRAHRGSVFVGADVSGPGTRIAVIDQRVDPTFDRARGDHDLALLLLAEPAAPSPVPLTDHDASTLEPGAELRTVGYGVTDPGTDTEGTRRGGVMSLTELDAFNLSSAPSPAMSCDGDSGGPVFATIDGVETLVAVTSSGDRNCAVSARNARVDERLDAFIRPAIAELEALPLPAPRDPARLAGLCGERCVDHEDCPTGLTCDLALDGLSYCSVGSLEPGALEEECASDVECRGRSCVRLTMPDGCRCFDPCFDAPMLPDAGTPDAGETSDPPAGCSVFPRRGAGRPWALFVLMTLAFARVRSGRKV